MSLITITYSKITKSSSKLEINKKLDENGLPCKAATELLLPYDDNLVLIMNDIYKKEGKTRKNVI